MKATEFRLTNLAQDKLTGEILICSGTSCESDGRDSQIWFTVLDRSKYPLPEGWQAQPIPLTEDWLLKFGFKETFQNKDSGYIELKLWDGKNLFEVDIDDESTLFYLNNNRVGNIKYVHQLQNLYFALTAKELKLRPTAA